MSHTLLHIDASARLQNSITRKLSAQIVRQLKPESVVRRDLSAALPLLTEEWINANFTPVDQRSAAQSKVLALSNELVDEIRRADTLVIGLPVYNFAAPAAFKAWIDLICRAGMTFRYTETGPVGLMTGKRAIVAIASGGTAVGSDIDFASGYVRHVLGFIGVTDVEIIAADQLMAEQDTALAAANAAIEKLAA